MTTNYKNSKKLADIGFDGESETWKHDPDNFILGQKYWSYDLETLLDALPQTLYQKADSLSTIQTSYEDKEYCFWWDKNALVFSNSDERLIEIYRQEDESLADTAARLILKLHEIGITNLK